VEGIGHVLSNCQGYYSVSQWKINTETSLHLLPWAQVSQAWRARELLKAMFPREVRVRSESETIYQGGGRR